MDSFPTSFLLVLAGLLILATALGLARRVVRPGAEASDLWRKYPFYILLAAAFYLAVWSPHAWHLLGALLALLAFVCSQELGRGLGLSAPACAGLALGSAGLTAAADLLAAPLLVRVWLIVVIFAVVSGSLVRRGAVLGRYVAGIAACLGLFPWCLASIIWLRAAANGDLMAVLLYTVVATNDAFAQIIGQLLGRRLLAPALSPGKTVEGVAGGLVLSIATASILFAIFGWTPLWGALAGATLAAAGLMGDLTVSGWKRFLGLKDFSTLLGAHGGALDRFDSLLFAAPIFFLLWIR